MATTISSSSNVTYFARSCSPSSASTNSISLACQTVGDESKTFDSSIYSNLVKYQAASTYWSQGLDGGLTAALSLKWSTVSLATFQQWTSAAATIKWQQDRAEVEWLMMEENNTPSNIEALSTDLQAYIVSAYLPQFRTTLTSYQVAVQIATAPITGSAATSVPISAAELASSMATSTTTSVLIVPTPGNSSTPSVDSPLWPTRKLVAITLPSSLALVVLICIFICLHKRKRRAQSGYRTPTRDYNAEPLFPHRPLGNLSDSSFTTEAGLGYGGMSKSKSSTAHLPILPELASPTSNPSELPASTPSSDETPELSADVFQNPFSNRTGLPRSTQGTPGVSPSSYPLRDRLNHDTIRRRHAIGSTRHLSNHTTLQSRRTSVSEQELRDMVVAFDLTGIKTGVEQSVRRSRSVGDITKFRVNSNGGM